MLPHNLIDFIDLNYHQRYLTESHGFLVHMGYRNCVYDIIINKYDKHKTRY